MWGKEKRQRYKLPFGCVLCTRIDRARTFHENRLYVRHGVRELRQRFSRHTPARQRNGIIGSFDSLRRQHAAAQERQNDGRMTFAPNRTDLIGCGSCIRYTRSSPTSSSIPLMKRVGFTISYPSSEISPRWSTCLATAYRACCGPGSHRARHGKPVDARPGAADHHL
jgi:hypothetical protein